MCICVKIINRGYQFDSGEDGRSLREGSWEKLEEGKMGGGLILFQFKYIKTLKEYIRIQYCFVFDVHLSQIGKV